MTKPTVALIGAGSAGGAMAVALYRTGYPIVAVASRQLASAQRCGELVAASWVGTDIVAAAGRAEIVMIATPDHAIEQCCNDIAAADGFKPGQLVVHLSGALSSQVLHSAASAGANTLSLHPAQTLVDPLQGAELLKSCWFCLDGDDAAIDQGTQIVNDLSAMSFAISQEKKGLYHAALSLSCNYLTTLQAIAVELLAETGISRKDALSLLLPLIQGSVKNLSMMGLPNALTGPISRGDSATVEEHLHALKTVPEDYLSVYKLMGLQALKIARAKNKMNAGSAPLIEKQLSLNL